MKDLIFVHMFQKRLNIRNKIAEKSVLNLDSVSLSRTVFFVVWQILSRYYPFQDTILFRNHPFQEFSFSGSILFRKYLFQGMFLSENIWLFWILLQAACREEMIAIEMIAIEMIALDQIYCAIVV